MSADVFWYALAYLAYMVRAPLHVEGTDVAALRVIVRACSVLWVWRSSDQSDLVTYYDFTVRCIQTIRWMVPLSFCRENEVQFSMLF